MTCVIANKRLPLKARRSVDHLTVWEHTRAHFCKQTCPSRQADDISGSQPVRAIDDVVASITNLSPGSGNIQAKKHYRIGPWSLYFVRFLVRWPQRELKTGGCQIKGGFLPSASQEISGCARQRGGIGRTRTSNQTALTSAIKNFLALARVARILRDTRPVDWWRASENS
jgi:hypothetical protein